MESKRSKQVGGYGDGGGNRQAELRPEAVARSWLHLDTIYGLDLFFIGLADVHLWRAARPLYISILPSDDPLATTVY